MAPEDENSLAVILFRVSSVEESLREMRTEMRGGFAGLSFVNKDVYQADQRAVDVYAQETRKIAENARSVAWANAALLLTAITVLLAVIKAVAS